MRLQILLLALIILIAPLTLAQGSIPIDVGARGKDFSYVLRLTGTSPQEFQENMLPLLYSDIPHFAKGDALLSVGRITNSTGLICASLPYYDLALLTAPTSEERASLHETIASIGCGRSKRAHLMQASKEWLNTNPFRSELDRKLALGEEPEFLLSAREPTIVAMRVPQNATKMVIGESHLTITREDTLLSQADRVNRDWLSYQLPHSPFTTPETLLTTFSERLTYTQEELLPHIGWHEGARIKEMRTAGFSHVVASGTLVKGFGSRWFAPNENGVFMFEVSIDKVLYPTTRFLRDDLAIVMDTHGISMLVEQALRKGADFVVGCCDHAGKAAAVEYLSERGISTICFTDKALPLLLGSGASALGSPPIKASPSGVLLGNQSIEILFNETIVAEALGADKFALSYYDTPRLYFTELESRTGLDLNLETVAIDDSGQAHRLTSRAKELGARLIAARVFDSKDYTALKEWLQENPQNRAILFHSEPYPYGYKILKEFPEQTTFDDPNPVFV